jgi:hypothetical protein
MRSEEWRVRIIGCTDLTAFSSFGDFLFRRRRERGKGRMEGWKSNGRQANGRQERQEGIHHSDRETWNDVVLSRCMRVTLDRKEGRGGSALFTSVEFFFFVHFIPFSCYVPMTRTMTRSMTMLRLRLYMEVPSCLAT